MRHGALLFVNLFTFVANAFHHFTYITSATEVLPIWILCKVMPGNFDHGVILIAALNKESVAKQQVISML